PWNAARSRMDERNAAPNPVARRHAPAHPRPARREGGLDMLLKEVAANVQLAGLLLSDSQRSLTERIVFAYGKLLSVPEALLPRPLAIRFRDIQIMLFNRPVDLVTGVELDRILEEADDFRKLEILLALRRFVSDTREALQLAR